MKASLLHSVTAAGLLLALAACDDDPTEPVETADPNVVLEIPTNRYAWQWASLPVRGPDATGASRRAFGPADRAYVGWHRAFPQLSRGDLDPDLSGEEAEVFLETLELRMVARDSLGGWVPDEFAGIMLGLYSFGLRDRVYDWYPGPVDLTGARYLEFWIDDGTGYVDPADPAALRAQRPGRLHIDFGSINEDFYWGGGTGESVLGQRDTEDADGDGRLGIREDGYPEDRGLDGLLDHEETEAQAMYGRPSRGEEDPAGDNYDPSDAGEWIYVYVNGTEGNGRLDTEDLSGDAVFDLGDGFYRLTLELDDPDPLLDPAYIYGDRPEFIEELRTGHRSWRLYLLDLRNARFLARGVDLDEPDAYAAAEPDLSTVKMLRIWYEPEGDGSDPAERRIRLAAMKFVRSPRR